MFSSRCDELCHAHCDITSCSVISDKSDNNQHPAAPSLHGGWRRQNRNVRPLLISPLWEADRDDKATGDKVAVQEITHGEITGAPLKTKTQ